MNNKIELLAPAGSKETFLSAIQAGADAIYVGLKEFSARAKAKNFSYSQLYKLCDYAKSKNVKIFVTFNTLLKQSDIQQALKCLEQINSTTAEAIIIQDLALANIAKRYFPKIKLHASTQLTIHNSFGVKQAKKMGFTRAILARELSFEQIKEIKNSTNLELEMFCHGALCFSVSGLCLFSSFIGGYSGNRGLCTQPCRRLWTVDNKQGYFLSPKDLQLADYVQQLKDIGITSLKIEGRMKNADYVYKTVKAYRLLLDSNKNDISSALQEANEILKFDYARPKTTCNFLQNSTDIFEPKKSKNIGLCLGNIENKTDTEFEINTTNEINIGDTLRIVNKTKDSSVVLIVNKISKNNNIYTISYNNIYIENGFELYKISDYQKNEFEDIFEEGSTETQPIEHTEFYQSKFKQNIKLPNLFIRIDNFKWLNLLKDNTSTIIIKLTKNNVLNIKTLSLVKNYFIELPPYIDEQDLNTFQTTIDFLIKKECTNFFVNNISHFEFFVTKEVCLYAGQYLYTLNTYTAEFLSRFNIKAFVTSWEDDLSNITLTSKTLHNNIIVFLSGFSEIARSKMTFVKEIENKNIKSDKDEFKIISFNDSNIIIPRYPISLFNFKNNLVKLKISSFAIDLSYIEPNQNYLLQVLKAFNGQIHINSNFNFNFERHLK